MALNREVPAELEEQLVEVFIEVIGGLRVQTTDRLLSGPGLRVTPVVPPLSSQMDRFETTR